MDGVLRNLSVLAVMAALAACAPQSRVPEISDAAAAAEAEAKRQAGQPLVPEKKAGEDAKK